jgi:hypothetical protein
MAPSTTIPASDAQLARSLAKLWPHRLHESSWLKNFFCWMRLHRWAQLDLRDQAPGREVWFCRWCDKIKIDGALHGD